MIEGIKVVIRQLELGDEELLHKWRNSSKGNEYCGFNHGFLISKEAYRLSIQNEIESSNVFPEEKTFIICKKDNLEPIGDVSYRSWDKRNRSAEFGIEIGDIVDRGQGYGLDTLYHFFDYLYNYLNLNRVELKTLTNNISAFKLYEKLGFKKIGYIREKSFNSMTGQYTDVLYMDLLRREWEEIKPTI
ncbi:GNAT family N-acetyltransferase [Vallitalea okinawensis]|uniref:GNAT family N-acetyltransferase n=1 Tax=Vallitalea okinawensis TaxID=2078660 RepID=UPI000CFD668B|nr:GNAT family protein [Vallitalea okinawensis]